MEVVNWLLVNGAEALRFLWALLAYVFGGLFAALDGILNPVLSPALAALNPVCTAIGDLVYAMLRPLPVWLGLTGISVVTGFVMLVAFRYVSNQAAIARAKDDIKANLLALKLYKDDLRVTFRSQGRLFWAIARLQRYVLTPVLVVLVPMLLALAQMGTHHQWRPLRPDERTLIRMRLDETAGSNPPVELAPSPGLAVEVGPVPGGGELVWRVRAQRPGHHTLRFSVNGGVIEKELVVGESLERVSAARVGSDWTAQLFHPLERRLPSSSPAASIEILYPGIDSWIHGSNWWVLHFFVVSMLTALVFKPVFKVRF